MADLLKRNGFSTPIDGYDFTMGFCGDRSVSYLASDRHDC
jgi:hypothetical protein